LPGTPEELRRILKVLDKIEELVAERPELEATEEETQMLQRMKTCCLAYWKEVLYAPSTSNKNYCVRQGD
jgi:hypothetical protein